MNVAIIGSGNIAGVHAKAIKVLGNNISHVLNINLNDAKQFANKFNIENYTDNIEDILNSDVEVVHICTPPTSHYEYAKACLLANKNVVCEKPFCLNSQHSAELYKIAKNKNLLCAINFNVRYYEAIKKAKSISNSNINLIHGNYLQQFHCLPTEHSWRYLENVSGKMRAVTEIASHWFDLLRYITGLEVKKVLANFTYVAKTRYLKEGIMYNSFVEGSEKINVNTEDCAAIIFELNNGANGNLLVSEISHGKMNEIYIEIDSDKNSIWWTSDKPAKLNTAVKFNGVNTENFAFSHAYTGTFTAFFEDVYTSLLNSEKDYPNAYDGYVIDKISECIYESANNNSKWVNVDYE